MNTATATTTHVGEARRAVRDATGATQTQIVLVWTATGEIAIAESIAATRQFVAGDGGTCGPILRCIADKLDFDEPRNPVVEVLRDYADQIDQAERALDENDSRDGEQKPQREGNDDENHVHAGR